MRDAKRSQRQEEIEAAAYAILEEKGYAGTSMQGIAKAARASNETLYKWYGDKQGLFQALVARNAQDLRADLEAALSGGDAPLSILRRLGPKLLALLLGDRAVALNRAAAADSSGELGAALTRAGRETILPLIAAVLARAQLGDAAGLYLDLLVGDLQIRRVINRSQPPDAAFCAARSDQALADLLRLRGGAQ